jgi:hemerythrin-like metal-binding protein
MTALTWTEALALHEPVLDATHQEFVEHLNRLDALLRADTPLPGLLASLQDLIAHTEAHFGMEEGWMAATGFAPENCHSRQHSMVLDVLRQVQTHVRAKSDLEPLKALLPELVQWFPQHADMMDASLVFHMRQVGFDPASGTCATPPGGEPISGCGSSSCS